MNHTTSITAVLAAAAALCLAVASPASAAPPIIDHWTDHIEHIEQDEHDDWCPREIVPFDVLYTEDARGTFRLVQHGDGLYYGGTTLKVEASWTNVDTGKTFNLTRSGADKDLKVTDNGDDTFTITGLSTGPTTYFDDDGNRLFIDTGRNFYTFMIDTMGTPSDADDEFTFLGADLKGHFETMDRDFCADIVEFIG